MSTRKKGTIERSLGAVPVGVESDFRGEEFRNQRSGLEIR